ncbi:MAG: alpha-2-macroglobulin family protein [Kofleriaceae bacterium]
MATSIIVGGCGAPAPRPAPKPVTVDAPSAVAPPVLATAGRPEVPLADPADGTAKMTIAFAGAPPVTQAGSVTTLSDARTNELLARMEPLPTLDNTHAPVMRAPSAAPARAGAVQPIAFLAPVGKPVADAPLSAVTATPAPMTAPSILPTGDVQAEAEIRIRFADAMVPVAKIGDVTAPPARVEPATNGTWRWIDTRVLGFFAAGKRLAQATTYTVTVPAGTKSLLGSTLAEDVVGTFSTKALALRDAFPSQLRPDSAIAVSFDAANDPAKLLPFLRVQTKAGKRIPFKQIDRATANAAWAKLPKLKVRDADLGTNYVLIAPEAAWPSGTELQIVLAKGAPSSEGPNPAAKPSYASTTVVPAFRLLGLECDDDKPRITGARCGAGNMFAIRFTNNVEESSYRAAKVQIDKQETEDRWLYGDYVNAWAPAVVGRTLHVVIGDGLVDVYGQPYTGVVRASFVTKPHVYDAHVDLPTGFHVIDPRFTIPQFVVSLTAIRSLHVDLYKVTPADYFAYEDFEQNPRAKPPGTKLLSKDYPVGARFAADLRVDLRPLLDKNGTGHVIAVATATPVKPVGKDEWFNARNVAWIQVTKLGITARHDGDKISAWTREIDPARFLAPIANAQLSIIREGQRGAKLVTASTDADGHATLALPERVSDKQGGARMTPSIVLAEVNGDSVFSSFGRDKAVRGERARWYVTDDRFTYKPGEKVYVKGWVRWSHDGVNPDIAMPARGDSVEWSLFDARRNRISTGTARLSDQGGFDLETTLPDTTNLGPATFRFNTRDQSTSHVISVQEFRTPAYSVTIADDMQFSGSRPLIAGESIEMRAEAKYFAGGGLPGADIRWASTLSPSTYRPPGWDRFVFEPMGSRSLRKDRWRGVRIVGEPIEVAQATTLSGESASTATFAIAATPAHRPALLSVDTTVADLDRMQIRASSRPILVHPSTIYVGVRQKPMQPALLETIVTNIDGKPVAGVPIDVRVEAVLGSERWRDDANVIDVQSCKLVSGEAPVTCAWKRGKPEWSYTAMVRVADARGRENSTEYAIPWWSSDDTRELSLVPDKATYRPGDTAKVEIRSATLPATAIVTIARNGVIREQQLALTKPSTTVDLAIDPAFISNVYVLVDRVSAARSTRGGSTLPFPQLVQEQVELTVDTESARLEMTTAPDKPLVEPGAMASFEVTVRHDEKPVPNAEVALMVVDEAILSLSSSKHQDPLAPFYQEYPANAQLFETLRMVRDQGPELAGDPGFTRIALDDIGTIGRGSGTGSGYGVGGGRGGMSGRSASSVIEARKDFRPVAVFAPLLHTDKDGKARVSVKMPDNLTRYRIVALATANMRFFGKAENVIVAQRMINARTIAPRFLTQGDRFSLPILVQNLASTPRDIEIAVRAANLVATGPQGKHVTLAPGQRAEVRFDFATQSRGKAVIQTVLVAGDQTDASNVELPVWEPATTESFATYGIVDDKPAFEQLAVPANVFPDVGGVELEVSSTQLQSLTDAFWYLQAYPYECAEQRSSRMLATSAMFDILDAYATPGRPTRVELAHVRDMDLKKLAKDQLPSGGWGYFPGMDVDPFVTAQVLSALGAQNATGAVRDKAIGYVTRSVDADLTKLAKAAAVPEAERTKTNGESAYRVSLVAAGLSALATAKADVRARVDRLHALATTLGTYPMDAKARVLALVAKQDRAKAMRAKLRGDILSATHETASAATVTSSFGEAERLLLVSSVKTNALALDALMREVPEHALIPKIARGVLEGRSSGRWRTTQDNLVVITAMRRYFDLYEKVEPNYKSKLWLGKAAYSEAAFVGRGSNRGIAKADWEGLVPGQTHDLAITKDGPGRMYYRVGITYAPKQTNLPPLDAGFVVRRSYAPIDDPADVATLPDGRIKVKLGARLLVRVQVTNAAARHAVAINDPLPAGFEAVNTALANAERGAPKAMTDDDSRWGFRALRDNRAEAFSMQLPAGTHQMSYTVRATTPGTFVAAPTKAEEMYSPETFGRSGGVTVVID